jgi:hypothetical protein
VRVLIWLQFVCNSQVQCHVRPGCPISSNEEYSTCYRWEPRSPYSDWLRAGRPRGWGSSPGRVKNFLFSTSSRPALGSTQPPIQWVTWALSPGVNRPWREVDHSPPANPEVKKMWIYTSTPSYVFMAQCLIS